MTDDIILDWRSRALISEAEEGKLEREIDALRAENERLKIEPLGLMDAIHDAHRTANLATEQRDALRAENERLKETIERGSNANAALEIENERLREECRLAAELQIRTGQEADAEIERLRAECIRWLQAIIDGPDLLSKTTAESAIKALASDKRA